MFIIVSKACDSCGGHISVRATTEKPTWESHISDNEKEIGGMFCIQSKVFACDLDGDPNSDEIEVQ